MKPEDIILIGVKRSVLAFKKETGAHLWATELASGMGDTFVSVISDDKKVYAHSGGTLHCLDLFTGEIIWRDKLSGFGYGVASLALAGRPAAATSPAYQVIQAQAAAAAQTTTIQSA